MLKYIKWICLIIAIIGITLLSIKFINYKSTQNNKNKEEKTQEKLTEIYNIAWYKTKIETYENNKITGRFNIIDQQYITFLESYIQHTNPQTGQINTYNFEYKNKVLTINDIKNYLPAGSYNLSLENEQLILSITNNNEKIIYYFTKAAG